MIYKHRNDSVGRHIVWHVKWLLDITITITITLSIFSNRRKSLPVSHNIMTPSQAIK